MKFCYAAVLEALYCDLFHAVWRLSFLLFGYLSWNLNLHFLVE
jgi:hypothetical protein